MHLEKEIERIITRKRNKLKKLCTDETSKQLVDEKFLEHSNLFTFSIDLKNFCYDFPPDILNLANLLTLAPSVDISKTSNISTNSEMLKVLIYRLLINLMKFLMSFFRRKRSSLTVQQYVVVREKFLALTLLICLAVISLRIKFLFFQKDSNLFLS